jgi:glycosyltransferase involved in cell wall biosynthesis
MKFSIITVCKNAENTIENTILSVINQSYRDFEYIIVDGVSTDKTLEIIEKYSDSITTIISEPDSGLYDAMNKGIAAAKGDYLFFLNADDRFLDDTTLEKTFIKAKNSDAELLYGDQVFKNRQTGEVSTRKHNKLNKIYLLKNTPCQPATFYRRDVFDNYGNFNTDFRLVSDHEWFLRSFLQRKFDCGRISALYLGYAITEFTTGGLSTSAEHLQRLNEERDRMLEMYFSPSERAKLEFASKYLRCLTILPVIKDILNLFFGYNL